MCCVLPGAVWALGPVHTGRGAPRNMRTQISEHIMVIGSVHTGCKQYQRVCTQICMQMCKRVLCERGLIICPLSANVTFRFKFTCQTSLVSQTCAQLFKYPVLRPQCAFRSYINVTIESSQRKRKICSDDVSTLSLEGSWSWFDENLIC